MTRPRHFATRVIHAAQDSAAWQGGTLPPIYQSAAQLHPTADSLTQAFSGQSTDHIYARLTNPTNQALEEKLADLEGGARAVVMASGMAAISNACLTLVRAGDEIVSGSSLFLSTYLLFQNVLPKYGVTTRLVNPTDLDAFAAAITEKTRLVYVEIIGNPAMDVPDLAALAKLAHHYGLPLVVDSTMASPWLCRPLELGADVVCHSTTKYLSGHGYALGGAVIEAGSFDWLGSGRYPDMAPFVERKGNLAFSDRLWRETHINLGPTQSPWHSFLTVVGLDTLDVRMERHMKNAQVVARYLADHPKVAWVNYPGLESHPSHAVAARQFGGRGFGGMLTFGLADQGACHRLIDSLEMVQHLANLGDCKTLIIHPWSTQFVAFEPAKKTGLGVTPDLLRLSVGIEHADDITADLAQALERV